MHRQVIASGLALCLAGVSACAELETYSVGSDLPVDAGPSSAIYAQCFFGDAGLVEFVRNVPNECFVQAYLPECPLRQIIECIARQRGIDPPKFDDFTP